MQADAASARIERLAEFAFDIVITDLRLPGIDGTQVIEAAVKRYPDIIAIVDDRLRHGERRGRK